MATPVKSKRGWTATWGSPGTQGDALNATVCALFYLGGELLIVCSSSPCQHRGIKRSRGAKSSVHESLQHKSVSPWAHSLTYSTYNPHLFLAQPARSRTTLVQVKRKPLLSQDTLKALKLLRKKKKPELFPLATLGALFPQLHFPPPSFPWCYLHTGFCCPTFVQPSPRDKINAIFN